ncbi:MAG: DNA-processing protein DprA [bacterium]
MAKWNNIDILKLSLTKGLNSKKQQFIMNLHDDYEEFRASYKEQIELPFIENWEKEQKDVDLRADTQLEIYEKNNIKMVTLFDDNYPALLKQISQPPILLFVKGELQNGDSTAIAIVGTRKCTTYGRLAAENYATHFARNNIIVVSGLAFGIDSYSHMAAVKAGGITYAVIAGGIDTYSQPEQLKKAEKIIDTGGALISHFHCGVFSLPPLFLQRNRIISGISTATVVIESAERGGSLNTARFAGDESRDVFAVPGAITSERSRGTNELIKKGGAIITLKPDDVLEHLGLIQTSLSLSEKQPNLKSKEEKLIWDAVSMEPIHIDDLADKTELEISKLLVVLLEMEFSGLLRQLPGKNYIREH